MTIPPGAGLSTRKFKFSAASCRCAVSIVRIIGSAGSAPDWIVMNQPTPVAKRSSFASSQRNVGTGSDPMRDRDELHRVLPMRRRHRRFVQDLEPRRAVLAERNRVRGRVQELSCQQHHIVRRDELEAVGITIERFGRRVLGRPPPDRIADDLQARRRFAERFVAENGTALRRDHAAVPQHEPLEVTRTAVAIRVDVPDGDRVGVARDDHRSGDALMIQHGVDSAVRGADRRRANQGGKEGKWHAAIC